MIESSIKELIEGLEKKHFSAVELTETFLTRIETRDQDINSFITISREQALINAKLADTARANGAASKLAGIPLAQKDIYCTKGTLTTCGSKMLHNFIAPYDATIVEKMDDAGMVMLGKTNMDEFAMGSSNENSYFGPVKNPWDLTRVPGGSSGGSAAAVAARFAPIATGSDTGGSIRQPAAFCGITGLKPTYGLTSRFGMIAYASSLDHGGLMARSAEDIALVLQVMAGFDSRDSTSASTVIPDYSSELPGSLKGKKIGLPKAFFTDALNPTIAALLQQTIRQYETLGAEIIEVDLNNMQAALPTYYIIAPAECSSNLARFDGVRYGYRADDPKDLNDLYTRTREEGFGNEVKRRILIGTYALSSGYYDAYYRKAQQVRRLIRDEFNRVLKTVDFLLTPATPTTAFELGNKSQDPVSMYLNDIYTIPANLAGIPAIAFPIGFAEGLPVGAQLIGSPFSEQSLLQAVHRYQECTDFHLQKPPALRTTS